MLLLRVSTLRLGGNIGSDGRCIATWHIMQETSAELPNELFCSPSLTAFTFLLPMYGSNRPAWKARRDQSLAARDAGVFLAPCVVGLLRQILVFEPSAEIPRNCCMGITYESSVGNGC